MLSFARDHKFAAMAAAGLAGLLAFWLLFDWNWLREPLERYVSQRTERVFRIDDLHVSLGLAPTIRMRNVVFENARWGTRQPMARAKELAFSVSLAGLWHGRVVIPELRLEDVDAVLERTADGRKNWLLSSPDDRSPSRLRILTLHLDGGKVSYLDAARQFELHISNVGLNGPGLLVVDDPKYQTRLRFDGTYRGAPFAGEALTSDLLSFQDSGRPFPLKGRVEGGRTRVSVEGTVADVVQLSAVDADVRVEGATLANLYPFLLLPLPASPPYEVAGHLELTGDTYRYDHLTGMIGSTDIEGDAAYVSRAPRPLLQVRLASRQTDIADLGPLVGVRTESGSGRPSVAAALGTRATAARSESAHHREAAPGGNDDRLLPSGVVDPARLKAIDADVSFRAAKLKAPPDYAMQSLRFGVHLEDARLVVDPLDLGFAGGRVTGSVTLDARVTPIHAHARLDARAIDLAKLIPPSPHLSPSGGSLAGHLELDGRGDSIARALADADGSLGVVSAGGMVSELADAAVALNGGKVLDLLATGDKSIPLRCGVVAFDFNHGVGTTSEFLVDTAATEIRGSGTIDLRNERLGITISPEPKHPGILSLRSPILVSGTFSHPDVAIDKTAVAEHLGGALALGILNPLAALIPLLEPGPGRDSDCQSLLAAAPPGARMDGKSDSRSR